MIEFANIAPIHFGRVFGIFDFGRCMSANVTVTNSAREGARYASAHTTQWVASTTPLTFSQARFGFQCPTGTTPTAPESDGAPGEAWRQLQAANLDLTQVTITVSYYSSSNDPTNGGTANDIEQCINAYGAVNYGTASESNTSYSPQSGDWVRVEVKYVYSAVTPVISAIVHNAITIDQTATMVLE